MEDAALAFRNELQVGIADALRNVTVKHIDQTRESDAAFLRRLGKKYDAVATVINTLAGWCYSKIEPPKEEDDIDPFTIDEQATILKSLTGQGRNLIQFAFWTGLRTSEYVALNWTDIDFVRGGVYVSKALTQHAEEPEKPKTAAGKREVKLLPLALEALENQKSFTWLKGDEVFQNPNTDERWDGDQAIRKTLWAHALKRGGVRYRKPYQTRHTYASMMLSAGEHPMWVAKQMGHADWTMIARVYGRWMPDADPNAGDKAVQRFGGNDSIMTTTKPKAA
ncbi:MAG: tyrosine-type recombinase/integrase [Collimonas sp.]|uniref:site-specific integrase n=1 Tax=Collimonas sp. TaxID=1963772 RepID=UPI003263D5D7